jgi:hypothetical protein
VCTRVGENLNGSEPRTNREAERLGGLIAVVVDNCVCEGLEDQE